jgi:hypothetical protein
MYLLFGDDSWWALFERSYRAIETHLKHGDWYVTYARRHACRGTCSRGEAARDGDTDHGGRATR